MPEPATKEEYLARFHKNTEITGFYLETTMHTPCPWCAAPDFTVVKILEVEKQMKRRSTCKECGREGLFLFQYGPGGSKSFEFVQTGGPDAPAWLEPPPRRI